MRSLQNQIREYGDILAQHGQDVHIERLLAWSGAAFRSYEFVPEDNYNWDAAGVDADWKFQSLDVDNYGAFEALAVHTGWERRVWNVPKLPSLLGLIRGEQEEGRKLLRYVGSRTERVLGITRDGHDVLLSIESLDGTERSEKLGTIKVPGEILKNAGTLVTVRPEVVESQERRRHAILRDMLLWVPRHHGCEKEIAYEKDCYFAAGRRATLAFTQGLLQAGGPQGLSDYQLRWIGEFVAGRRAAATFWRDDDGLVTRWLSGDQTKTIQSESEKISDVLTSDLGSIEAGAADELEPIQLADALSKIVSAEDAIVTELRKGTLAPD